MIRFVAAVMISTLPLVSLSTVSMAAETASSSAAKQDVDKELKKLMKAYGAGEISSKQYKTKKEELEKSAQVASGK